jgi:autoinducer 2-degrading protein
MQILIVEMNVRPDQRDRFLEILTYDAQQSVAVEPGCLRFDLLEDVDTPNRFYFYEVYRDGAAIHAHCETAHFKQFADALPEMIVGELRRSVATNLYPSDLQPGWLLDRPTKPD